MRHIKVFSKQYDVYVNVPVLRSLLFDVTRGVTQSCQRQTSHSGIRDGRFGSKFGQIVPKWDKSGTFSDIVIK